MNTRTFVFLPILACSLLAGCNESNDDSATITQWLGEETHFVASGTVQGNVFDVRLEGSDAAGVYCNRFYTPLPGEMPAEDGTYTSDQVYYAMSMIGGIVQVNGETKEFNVVYWKHDLAGGSVLEVVPREFGGSIPAGKTWANINLFQPGEHILSGLETAASSGTVELLLNDGPTDENGVMRTGGKIGVFMDLSWGPREDLVASVTADCQSIIVPWATDLVQP